VAGHQQVAGQGEPAVERHPPFILHNLALVASVRRRFISVNPCYAGSLTDAMLGLVEKTGAEAQANRANATEARRTLQSSH
jgi:hypothetical protein